MGLRPICCGIVLGENAAPLPSLPADGTRELLSAVTITVTDPADVVRFTASIWSATQSSTVLSVPLRGNVILYSIVRASDDEFVRNVENTDFDELTTTFTAFDEPGAGTFTYYLFGSVSRSTEPVQSESILSVDFTAEELHATT